MQKPLEFDPSFESMMRSYVRRRGKTTSDHTNYDERDKLQEPGDPNAQKADKIQSEFPLQGELPKLMSRVEMYLRLQQAEEEKKPSRTKEHKCHANHTSDFLDSPFTDIKGEKRRVRCEGVSYNADQSSASKIGDKCAIGCCQFLDKPMTKEFRYFEVTIVDYGRKGWIGVGLAHQTYPLDTMPGWDIYSVAYHCDDGQMLYHCDDGKMFLEDRKRTRLACPAQEGDVIGCGIRLNPTTQDVDLKPIVFFTRNGEEMGSKEIPKVPKGGFFPIIGLGSEGERVDVNLDVEWKQSSTVITTLDGTEPMQLTNVKKPRWKRDCIGYNERNHIVSYTCGQDKCVKHVGVFQDLSRPMTAEFNYFEVKLLCIGRKRAIGIGIANAAYPLNTMPGLKSGSAAFHCDNGNVFKGVPEKQTLVSKPTPASRHDVIGCGIELIPGHGGRAKAFFTRNHNSLIAKFELDIPSGGFYPTIGMMSYGEEVKLNFDTTPPPQTLSVKGCAVKYRSVHVSVHEDMIKFAGHPGSIGVYQDVSRQMSREFSYFELKLKDYGQEGAVAIGLATNEHNLGYRRGCTKNSVAWHLIDNHLYKEENQPTRIQCAPVNEQDVIGCGIDFTKTQKKYVESRHTGESVNYSKFVVFFTHNRRRITDTIVQISEGLFPTVSMQSPGEVVQINTSPDVGEWDVTAIRSIAQGLDNHERVRIRGDRIYYVDNRWNDVGGIQLKTNMRDQKYFEVKILSKGEKSTIGIGMAKKGYRLDWQPGWLEHSIAFHCDDGYLHYNGTNEKFFNARHISKNDTIGCGIDKTTENATGSVIVYFTHNGKEIGRKQFNDNNADNLYPTVGMHSSGEAIKIILTTQRENDEQDTGFSRSERISTTDDKVIYKADDTHRPGVIQLVNKVTKALPSFEVTIDSLGHEGAIGIGLAPKDYRLDCMPGWLPNSVGYHSNDGCLFEGTEFGRRVYEMGSPGVTLGCGVDYSKNKENEFVVYFTYNGQRQAHESKLTCPKEGLFPTIGLLKERDEITFSRPIKKAGKQKNPPRNGQYTVDDEIPLARQSILSQ